ncbi:hypothetical protein KQI48_11285 [Cellulomonas hominis]|uniref:hypothetical protein n=1 Tax=Cellulomonas hominis TaxID=156981 RepID=UPI001C10C60E|nr:hypothetical protein [Cellulomonas hominis]MBU5423249.1 hypothetical protein [Cellulomonas hominis]
MDYEDTVNYTSGTYVVGAVTATATTVVLPTGSAAYGIADTVGAGVQGARAVQSGDSAGAVLNELAVATGAGGVVSAFGRAFSWVAAASSGSSFVRSGTWWSRLGQISGHIEWFGGAALTGATTAHLVGQTC